ncbi:hypothetical protein DFH27DRAFT_619005 [Peziza echinospora]|nr:hypothetical protein DFH27DRAFT_619005 [Peziza echinospora]
MVTNQRGVVRLVLEEFNIYMDPSDNYEHSNPQERGDKHSKVTLSAWNIGLLDGLDRLHQVPDFNLNIGGVVHNISPNCNGRTC